LILKKEGFTASNLLLHLVLQSSQQMIGGRALDMKAAMGFLVFKFHQLSNIILRVLCICPIPSDPAKNFQILLACRPRQKRWSTFSIFVFVIRNATMTSRTDTNSKLFSNSFISWKSIVDCPLSQKCHLERDVLVPYVFSHNVDPPFMPTVIPGRARAEFPSRCISPNRIVLFVAVQVDTHTDPIFIFCGKLVLQSIPMPNSLY